MSMSISYEQKGRTSQKARTRAAMLDATRGLLADGETPTVEQAAQRAGVSRATAYRYFANQAELLLAAYPELDRPSLLGDDPPSDPDERFDRVTDAIIRHVLDHEAEQRTMLRLSLDPACAAERLPLRKGRAIGWLEDALEPLRPRLGDAGLRTLALSIRATIGIEALVWLTDVGGLSRDEAAALMRRSAWALLRAATD